MNLKTLGVVFMVLGAAALLLGNLSYTETEPVAKVGPLQVEVQKEERILNIPTVAGIVVLFSGLVLVILFRRGA
ncbi:MAG: hypothetical protein ACT4OG_00485 [Alphaproteobacteria bacterium]